MLGRAGQDVEKSGFAAVLLACKGEFEKYGLGKRVLVVAGVVLASLAKTRVGVVIVQPRVTAALLVIGPGRRDGLARGHRFDLDSGGVGNTKGKGVTVYLQLDRIAQRRPAHHLERGAGNKAHVQEMHAGRTFSAHTRDGGGDPSFQFVDCQHCAAKILLSSNWRNT